MRLPPSRLAGIAAWTAAAVAWGTAAVASANPPQVTPSETLAPTEPEPAIATATTEHPALPTVPETGLVIIRYTPVPVPEPVTITERRVVAAPSSSPGRTAPPPVQSGGS